MVFLIDGSDGSVLKTIANPNASTGFGLAVAAVGSNILIGSPVDGTAGANAGAAFLYSSAGALLQTFVQPDGGSGHFGASVAASGTEALIGAPEASLGTADAGAAYLFDADQASPTFGQAISVVQEPVPAAGDQFGTSVTFDDGSLVVGAAGADGDSSAGAESAYLYQVGAALSISSQTTYATAPPFDSVFISGTFLDPGGAIPLKATIDWGDGSMPTVIPLLAGAYAFSAPHDYTDDSSAEYSIGVTLSDSFGMSTFAQTSVAIADPAPQFAAPGLVLSQSTINENDSETLSGTIISPGGIDANTVSIDWGDGSQASTIQLDKGVDTFSTSHVYLNNPVGVTSGSFTIHASVTDEDGKIGTASTAVTVANVAPQFTSADLHLSETTAVENDNVTLTGRFSDPGTLDPHTVTIEWGDGSAPSVLLDSLGQIEATATPGEFTYSGTHQYLNNPSGEPTGGEYGIQVFVSDDVSTASAGTSIIVNNVSPTVRIESLGNQPTGTISLAAIVTDPGATDTETLHWTLTVDGVLTQDTMTSTLTFTIPASFTTLVATATATDSDGGMGSGSARSRPSRRITRTSRLTLPGSRSRAEAPPRPQPWLAPRK